MPTYHFLTQYLWPDDAPTGVYAEQVAEALTASGKSVVLVGSRGRYRKGERNEPKTRRVYFPEPLIRNRGLTGKLWSYGQLARHFNQYIARQVKRGDVVVVTSAPHSTLFLAGAIRRQGARSVYWLQDFLPELLRGVFEGKPPFYEAVGEFWRDRLKQWDFVVKAAGNLACEGENTLVIRNWPLFDLGGEQPAIPKTALYSGNLGYAHHMPSLIAACEKLRGEGFQITIRADGKGVRRLPEWLRPVPPIASRQELTRSFWQAEVHLIAGHPEMPGAVFPSKIWSALAANRQIVATGFPAIMQRELEESRRSLSQDKRRQWVEFLASL